MRVRPPSVDGADLKELLLECLQAEQVFLLLTDASSVLRMVTLLRAATGLLCCDRRTKGGRNVLVGCDEWAMPALDIVVATPSGAYEMLKRGVLSCLRTRHVVVEEEAAVDSKVHNVTHMLPLDATVVTLGFSGRKRLFAPADDQLQLPEMLASPALGSLDFFRYTKLFIQGHSLVQDDQSAILGFILGILQQADSKSQHVQALILVAADKAELLVQFMQALALHVGVAGLRVACVNNNNELQKNGVHVAVASPDALQREGLELSHVKQLVLIELDKLGFTEQIGFILNRLPDTVQVGIQAQTIACSAVDKVVELVSRKRKPPIVASNGPVLSLEKVAQYFLRVGSEEEKVDAVINLWSSLQMCSIKRVCVFCNSPAKVTWLAKELKQRGGIWTCSINSDMSREVAAEMKRRFEEGEWQILVTNVGSQRSNPVINFELPERAADYLDRVGRLASVAINLVTVQEVEQLQRLEQHHGTHIRPMPSDVFEAIALLC